MKPQLQVIKMKPPNSTEKAMYQPIKDISIGGVVMVKSVRDAEGDRKEEIVEPVKTSRKEDASTEEEPEPPEPFEYTE
jgi:26S proteasome regulatory subunit N2